VLRSAAASPSGTGSAAPSAAAGCVPPRLSTAPCAQRCCPVSFACCQLLRTLTEAVNAGYQAQKRTGCAHIRKCCFINSGALWYCSASRTALSTLALALPPAAGGPPAGLLAGPDGCRARGAGAPAEAAAGGCSCTCGRPAWRHTARCMLTGSFSHAFMPNLNARLCEALAPVDYEENNVLDS